MKRTIKCISLILALFILITGVALAEYSDNTLFDNVEYTSPLFGVVAGDGEHSLGQTFIPTDNYSVTHIGVMLYRDGTNPGTNFYIGLGQSDDGQDGEGDWTSCGPLSYSSISTNSAGTWYYYPVTEGNSINITAGDNYTLRMSYPAGTYGSVDLRWKGGSNGLKGQAWEDTDNWTSPECYGDCDESWDLFFKIYGSTNPIMWDDEEEEYAGSEYDEDEERYYVDISDGEGCFDRYAQIDGEWIFLYNWCSDAGTPTEISDAADTVVTGIGRSMAMFGWDNATGQWIVLLAIAVILFAIFRKSKTMRVIMPLGSLVFGIIIGWVETWIIILIALLIGLVLAQYFRRNKGNS